MPRSVGNEHKRGSEPATVRKPMSETQQTGRQPKGLLVLRTLAMPKDTNPSGDGGLMASEISRGRVVTVSVEKMSFDKPVRMGDTICVHAELLRVGSSSMDIKLEVWARQLVGAYEAERQLVTEGVFRYVAVDDDRRPRKVPINPLFFTRE
jgi:acyl-CoA thioesterase YciA